MKEWLGLLIPISVLLAIYLAIRSGGKMRAKIDAKASKALPAKAKVLAITDATTTKPQQGYTVVKLTLDIHPSLGNHYETSTRWSVQIAVIPQLQPGELIDVKIDADNKEIIYPAADWAYYMNY